MRWRVNVLIIASRALNDKLDVHGVMKCANKKREVGFILVTGPCDRKPGHCSLNSRKYGLVANGQFIRFN